MPGAAGVVIDRMAGSPDPDRGGVRPGGGGVETESRLGPGRARSGGFGSEGERGKAEVQPDIPPNFPGLHGAGLSGRGKAELAQGHRAGRGLPFLRGQGVVMEADVVDHAAEMITVPEVVLTAAEGESGAAGDARAADGSFRGERAVLV